MELQRVQRVCVIIIHHGVVGADDGSVAIPSFIYDQEIICKAEVHRIREANLGKHTGKSFRVNGFDRIFILLLIICLIVDIAQVLNGVLIYLAPVSGAQNAAIHIIGYCVAKGVPSQMHFAGGCQTCM